jgi:hypothetical protein
LRDQNVLFAFAKAKAKAFIIIAFFLEEQSVFHKNNIFLS